MGAVQAAIDALVELVEFLFEIAFDISPAGNVGKGSIIPTFQPST